MEGRAVYLTKATVTRNTEVDKYALKLLGIGNSEENNEKILESLSEYILPSSIKALVFDPFNNFYVLFLTNIESFCCLVGKTLKFEAYCIEIYPLLDCFSIDNAYPCISNEKLRDIFKSYGNVFKVSYRRIVSNSSTFSHVISGQREITFSLPGKERKVCIPLNVVHPPHLLYVRRFCCACFKDHSVLDCSTLKNGQNSQIIKCENDSELESSIKVEEFHFSQIIKCEGSENDSKLESSIKSKEFHSSQIIKCEGSENDSKLESSIKSEEFHSSQIIKCEGSENDNKLESSIKSEEFHSFEDYKVEDPVDSDEKLKLIKLEEFPSIENSKIEDPASKPHSCRHSQRLRKKAGKN